MSWLDVEKANQVCVLGAGAKQALFDYTDPVGETITINGIPFLVVGWYNSMEIEYWPEMDNVIVLPYTHNRTLNGNSTIDRYVVKAKNASATIEAMTRLDAFLAGMFPKNADGWSENGSYDVSSDNSYAQAAGGRHRHYEHYAGHRYRTHPGDRHSQGHRRRAQQHHHPVSH